MALLKKGVVLKRRNPIYTINISKNIFESSSEPETEEKKKARVERDARRAQRRAQGVQQKLKNVSTTSSKEYDILAFYHQLNYANVRNVLKYMNIKPKLINNSYVLLKNLSEDVAEELKTALLECHFETKTRKQYKVQVVVYKSVQKTEPVKQSKKVSNNSNDVAAKAKSCRKLNKQKCFTERVQHTTGRKTNKVSHRAATIDTSNLIRKISIRAKKACAYLEKKEREAKIQAERLSKLQSHGDKKVIQRTINF